MPTVARASYHLMPGTTTQEHQSDNRSRLTPASLFFVLLLLWTFTQIQLVLVLGLLALLIGTILERPVQFFEEQRFPRPAAILAVYVIILGSLALLLVAIVPMIADQASEFSEDVPNLLRELEADWSTSSNPILSGPGDQLLQRAIGAIEGEETTEFSPDAIDRAIPVVTSITGGLVSTLTLLVMTFYYLLEKRLLRRLIIESLSARFQPRVDRLWTEVETKVGGWMRGQLALCLIIGTIATVSYGIVGLNFWPLLGLWAGLTEIIPIIGPWIGGVPAVLIALTMSWEIAVITTAIIVGMQSLENWVLVPRVMRGAVGLTPLTVFVAILAGTQLMGVIGAVLAIPIAATIQVILTDFLNRRQDRDGQMTARSGWRWMLARSGIREPDPNDDPVDDWREDTVSDDEGSYAAQQESESFSMPATPPEPASATEADDTHDSSEDPQPTVQRPDDVEKADVAESKSDPDRTDTARRNPKERNIRSSEEQPEDTDDLPAFAAWPHVVEEARKKLPSSTWPPPEEGRPDRLRRNKPRRDD